MPWEEGKPRKQSTSNLSHSSVSRFSQPTMHSTTSRQVPRPIEAQDPQRQPGPGAQPRSSSRAQPDSSAGRSQASPDMSTQSIGLHGSHGDPHATVGGPRGAAPGRAAAPGSSGSGPHDVSARSVTGSRGASAGSGSRVSPAGPHGSGRSGAANSREDSPTDSPMGSPTGLPMGSPSGSPVDSPIGSPMGSPTGSARGSPSSSREGSPVGSIGSMESARSVGSQLGDSLFVSPEHASTPSLVSARASPAVMKPNLGQSIILSKVPRYVRLSVEQPQKVSDGSASYVSYLVTAQQYPEERPERVRRRFSEFAKLYEKLSTEFPACAIPPLPDRWRIEYIAGDRFSPEFTTKRAASLERFLFRVSQHPSLRRSRAFAQFLSPSAGGAAKSNSSASGQASGGTNGAAANGAQESAAMVALDHIGEAIMNAFVKARHQSKEMVDARERADRYEQNIATIDKAVVRASKTQSDLAADFEDMHRQAVKLAKLEPRSGPEFEQLALTAQSLMGATVSLRQGTDSNFACALRDMAHYVQALKGMLKQREQRQIDYEALVEYLKRSEHELVATEHGHSAPAFSSSFLRTKFNELRGVDKEQSRQHRITKLKARISELKDESARAKQVSDDFEELAQREVRVFDQTEAIELQQSLAGLSDSYIDFFQTVLRECREVEASLD